MGRIYTTSIKDLKKKENKKEIEILRVIASFRNQLFCGNIQYRNLYRDMHDFFQDASKELGYSGPIRRRQFKVTYYSRTGKYPVYACVYLYAVYLALKDCINQGAAHHITLEQTEQISTFTRYVAKEVRRWLDIHPQNANLFTAQELFEFNLLEDGLNAVDNRIALPMGEIL